jgi:ABC-type multidrug transport system permease subunit
MNWRKFLEPDFTKLIVFFAIEFITVIITVIPALPLLPEILIPFNFIISSFINLTNVNPTDFSSIQYASVILGLIRFLDLVWHYLISCFIIWVYTRVKKKK